MFQTMEGNAKPHAQAAESSEADLLRSLQAVSDNIMRLAGTLRADSASARRAADTASIHQQNALAQDLIGRLLAMPAARA
jgi:hypothetical protein